VSREYRGETKPRKGYFQSGGPTRRAGNFSRGVRSLSSDPKKALDLST
jgi:hypothetical protein